MVGCVDECWCGSIVVDGVGGGVGVLVFVVW